MAKFCTECGKKLEKGVCDCKKSNTKEKKVEVIQSNNELLDKVVEVIKGIVISPITIIKTYTKSINLNLGLVLILLSAITFSSFATINVDTFFSILGLGIFQYSGVSELEMFVTMLIGGLIFNFVLAGIAYFVLSIIYNIQTNVKKIITFIGIISMIMSLTYIAAIIGFGMSFEIGFLILMAGILFYIVNFYHGLKIIETIDDEKCGVLFIMIYTFQIIAMYVLMILFN